MKHYTKGSKRRFKKLALANMPELAEVPKKQPNGRVRREREAGDPRNTALDARCRQMGRDATRTGRRAMTAPHIGCQVGMIMEASSISEKEINRRWRTFTDYLAAEAAYHRHYIGQGEYPKSAAMLVVQEKIEADATRSPDLRSEEERAADAVRNWMRWQGHLGYLDVKEREAITAAKRDVLDLWKDQAPTELGIRAVLALKRLADVVSKRDG